MLILFPHPWFVLRRPKEPARGGSLRADAVVDNPGVAGVVGGWQFVP
jgi:hypothetical protein